MVEFSLVMTLLLLLVFGFVDFGYAVYQWNQAAKAVQVGARLAAVSAPVASNMTDLVDGLNAAVIPGDPSEDFSFECDGDSESCTNDDDGYSQDNLDRIVFGGTGPNRKRGMRDIFSRIEPENVVVSYSYSGLGYVFRPGGPIPTIQVRLQNLNFRFFFLGDLLGFDQLPIPAMTGTITGEDLCNSGC